MPKALMIMPEQARAKGRVEFTPIPVNAYDRTVKQELGNGFAKDDLVRIQHDMQVIRAFESMLDSVKKQGVFAGISYNHRGPAHLSIGQESTAVGQAYLLGVEDHIYGSHRSHGEILAKGLSAIHKLPEDELLKIMKGYFGGTALKVVEQGFSGSVKDLAVDYLVYSSLAEIFARETGINKGMGGSMHAYFPPFGIYPNNAIVGGSADIAVGAALFKLVNHEKGLVIANIGDASAGCGPVWEGLAFSVMDQIKELWTGTGKKGLPFILHFNNNFYGMGGQPVGETMGFKVLARMGAGLCPNQMHAERVDGFNPLAVIDAIRRKKAILEAGDGPVLMDTVTYRYSGHSPSDASSYRDKTEVEAWQKVDPLNAYARSLVDAGVTDDGAIAKLKERIDAVILRCFKLAIDPRLSPYADLKQNGNLLERTMFSNGRVEKLAERKPEVTIPTIAENPRTKGLAGKARLGVAADGKALAKKDCLQLRDALFESIIDTFYTDPTLVAYGEENRDWGGAFAVYRGLTEALPYHRLFNSPISEAAIVGTAVGYALEGGRPLVELMYCDFMGRAGDEIFNQMAKWQSMSAGVLKMPVVLRVSVGSKYGAQHSQDWTALCAHIPGLKVCFPATPHDAKGLMYSALTGTDPVVFFESQRLYDQPELFRTVPEGRFEIPFGSPDIKKPGKDLTMLTVGATLYRALDAAKELEAKWGISCEVIDARSIVPFDYGPVLESVRKTRKIVLASDASARGSILQTFAADIATLAFDDLDAPPVVVGARNWITPPDEMEDAFFPFPVDIIDAIHSNILPLKGYTPARPCDRTELLRRAKAGI